MATLTHPDGFAVDYNYDVLGRPVSVVNGTKTLATVAYDDHGRRASLSYGNRTGVNYNYDGGSRLDELDWDLNGTGEDFSYAMSFTPSSQLASLTTSDTSLAWVPAAASVDDYTANGLNQYEEIDSGSGGVSVSYDAKGNITTDHRGRSYIYDAENHLNQVLENGSWIRRNVPSSEGLVRYRRTPSLNTYHIYDGDQEIFEFVEGGYSAPEVTRRYIRLPGSVDEVLLMIDYTRDETCTNANYAACEVWAHHDRLGSTVRTSDSMSLSDILCKKLNRHWFQIGLGILSSNMIANWLRAVFHPQTVLSATCPAF